jgi:predicted transcriptional regulator
MRRALIETISRSEKRKDVLMLLQEGAAGMNTILDTLEVSRNSLLPQIKILEENYLITKNDDSGEYMLTKFGELIVNNLQPLLGTLEVLENRMEYWMMHNTDCIPDHLFDRLRELESCELAEPELCQAMELSRVGKSMCLKSDEISVVVSFYHSDFPDLYMQYANNGSDFKLIITEGALYKFITGNKQCVKELIRHPNISIHTCPDNTGISALVVTPEYMLLRLLTEDGRYDPRYLSACKGNAIQWGNELFQHYLDQSVEVKEL